MNGSVSVIGKQVKVKYTKYMGALSTRYIHLHLYVRTYAYNILDARVSVRVIYRCSKIKYYKILSG